MAATKPMKPYEPKGKPYDSNGNELYECDNCSTLWREDDLDQLRDAWERIEDGYPMSTKQCPDCGAMAFPADGDRIPVEITLMSSQEDDLKKHIGHDLQVVILDKKMSIVCRDCGNAVKRTVTDDEISKTDEQMKKEEEIQIEKEKKEEEEIQAEKEKKEKTK